MKFLTPEELLILRPETETPSLTTLQLIRQIAHSYRPADARGGRTSLCLN